MACVLDFKSSSLQADFKARELECSVGEAVTVTSSVVSYLTSKEGRQYPKANNGGRSTLS